jgi:hypothetical protein
MLEVTYSKKGAAIPKFPIHEIREQIRRKSGALGDGDWYWKTMQPENHDSERLPNSQQHLYPSGAAMQIIPLQ